MKKLLFTLCFSLGGLIAAQAQTAQPAPTDNPKAGDMKFKEETHDFGNIPQGVPASYTFKFKNTGKEPLVISSAHASCGCTTPEWTKEPVKPGKEGFVKATYNAASPGSFTKTVTVTSNGKNPNMVLYIKGNVEAKEPTPAGAPLVK